MDDLYYIERDHSVKAVTYTRTRAMSVSPIFYAQRYEALQVARERLERQIDRLIMRRDLMDEELMNDPR